MRKRILPIFVFMISVLLSLGLVNPGFACDFEVFKFEDLNGNGAWDPGEPPIDGWLIRLYQWVQGQSEMYWQQVAESRTNEDGRVIFSYLPGGQTWRLWEEQVECWEPTTEVLGPWEGGYYVEFDAPNGSFLTFYFGNRENCVGSCRMTGGNATVSPAIGEDGLDTWSYDFKSLGTGAWITTGGQIGAPSGGIPRGHWTHTQHEGAEGSFTFHSGTSSAPDGTEISTIECNDPGWCVQARCAPFKQLFWTGVGNFAHQHYDGQFTEVTPGGPKKGGTLHYYRAMVGDFGENNRPTREIPGNCEWGPLPGPWEASSANFLGNSGLDPKFGDKGGQICDTCPDYYQIEIYATTDPSSDVIYTFFGFLESGNYQIHPATGEQCPASRDLVPELFEKRPPGKATGHN